MPIILWVRTLDRVVAVRNGDPHYIHLNRIAKSIFAGRRCVVLGSAPDFLPPKLQRDDVLITVNGSAYQLQKMGRASSDVTFIVGAMFSDMPEFLDVSTVSIGVLTGGRTGHCFVFSIVTSFARVVKALNKINFHMDFVHEITGLHKAAMIGEACGAELGFGGLEHRLSSGATAITMALWGGAKEVVFSGFSLEGGHCYLSSQTKRWHMIGDEKFFRLCAEREFPVSTTDEKLSRRFKIKSEA